MRDPGELRRRVQALGRRRRGVRIPDKLRVEVIRYAMERRRCGEEALDHAVLLRRVGRDDS